MKSGVGYESQRKTFGKQNKVKVRMKKTKTNRNLNLINVRG